MAGAQSYNVAFSARVGYNRPYLGETEVIVFDELVINNGDVYDPYSGRWRRMMMVMMVMMMMMMMM